LTAAGLRDDVTIVPVGGLDKVVTFVALLGANGLKLAVLHDYPRRTRTEIDGPRKTEDDFTKSAVERLTVPRPK
jgi:hypothetical protein